MEIEKSPKKLKLFNQVRLFLQVFYLSDIADPSGTKIEKCFLKHTDRSTWPSFSKIHWPIQGYPTSKAWQIWSMLLRKRYLIQKSGRLNNFTLESKLGDFFPPSKRHRVWKWEFDSTTLEMVHSRPTSTTIMTTSFETTIHRRKIITDTSKITDVSRNPSLSFPICMREKRNNIITFERELENFIFEQIARTQNRFLTNQKKTKVSKTGLKKWERPLFDNMQITKPNFSTQSFDQIYIGTYSENWGSNTLFGWTISRGKITIARGSAFVPS